MSASILVTGGAGLIGSALIHALNQRGQEEILVTDVLGKEEKWKNLSPLRFDDYLQADALLDLLDENPDALGSIRTIYHLGACSATTETDVAYLMENNYGYTKRLAQWALSRGIRFVYASSAATYGDGTLGMNDDLGELHTLRPLNAYGYSKHLFDLHAWRNGWLDRIVGIKYFNVYGPNEGHKGEMRSLVAKAYEQILETGKVRLFRSHRPDFRDGEQMRDFIFVDDCCDAMLWLMNDARMDAGTSALFNLGTGRARTFLELAAAVYAGARQPLSVTFRDTPQDIRGQYQYFTQARMERLRAAGYTTPFTDLADGVAITVERYLAQADPYR